MSNVIQFLSSIVIGSPDRAQGVDLSHWDGFFKPELAAQRIDFAFQKITEGTTFVDPSLEEIWSGVQKIAVRGAYHYQCSGMSWLMQADHFLKVAGRFDYHIYALDVETIGNIINDTFFADVRRIIDHWRKMAPTKKIVLYTNFDIYKQLSAAIIRLYPDGAQWLAGVPFWYAWPTTVFNEPFLPAARSTWDFWQWSWVGTKEDWGTGAAVDLNVYNGTREQLHAWLTLLVQPPTEPELPPPPPPTPEPAPEPKIWAAAVTGYGVRVRTLPHVAVETDTKLRVNNGEKFTGQLWSGAGYVWIKVHASARTELIGKWIAVRTLDGTQPFIRLAEVVTTPPLVQLYRVKHDLELGGVRQVVLDNNKGYPEVYRMTPDHQVLLTEPLQWLWKNINPMMTSLKWRALLADDRAFTNGTGFPGHRDYVNRVDMDMPLPRLHTPLICGGAVVTGIEMNGYLLMQSIDTRCPLPTVTELMSKPWLWFCATTVRPDGSIGRFPQGDGQDVRVPLMSSQPIQYPLSKLIKLPLGSRIPSPYEVS